MENSFDLKDILGVLRRRWLIIALPLALGVPLSIGVAMLLPSVYAATARIIIESQQIPTDLARSTVAQSAAERIQLIQQRLLTRQTLLDIAEQYNVFRSEPNLTPSDVVQRMRQATRLQSSAPRSGRRAQTSVTSVEISFRAADPNTAARVANELVNRVIEENVQSRTDRASGTLAFFDQQVERLANDTNALAARIAQFKTDNQGALPSNLSERQSEFAALRERRFDLEAQRQTLEDQRDALEQAIRIGAVSPDGGTQRNSTAAELQRLRAQRVQLGATLNATHPTIRQLDARIAALEASASAVADAAVADDDEEGGAAERGGQATTALAQVERIEARLDAIETQIEVDDARIAELTQSITRTPNVEMELDSLERAYASLQIQFREASLKRAEAQIGERLEASQRAERFEVIEQAIPADEPVSPNRRRIVAMGFAGSLAVGIGLVLLLELLNNAIRTTRDMERRLNLHPIVSIPYIRTAGEERRRRWTIRLVLFGLIVGAPLALFAVDQFIVPLPILLDAALERLRLDTLISRLQAAL